MTYTFPLFSFKKKSEGVIYNKLLPFFLVAKNSFSSANFAKYDLAVLTETA